MPTPSGLEPSLFCVHSVPFCGSGMDVGASIAAELNLPGWGVGGLEPGLVLEVFRTEVTAKAPAGVCEVSLRVGGGWCELA